MKTLIDYGFVFHDLNGLIPNATINWNNDGWFRRERTLKLNTTLFNFERRTKKMSEDNKPEYKAKVGNCSATVWKNKVNEKDVYSISLSKSYKDKDGKWQNSTSLFENDVWKMRKALAYAQDWCISHPLNKEE